MYTNIANYIYDIFETTHAKDLPDVTLGLAHLRVEKEIPEGITDKQLRMFMGRKIRILGRLYGRKDREFFVDVVEDLVKDYLAPDEDVSEDV